MLTESAQTNKVTQLVYAQLRERQGWFKALLDENWEACALLKESLATFRHLEVDLEIASTLEQLGHLQALLGKSGLAEQSFRESAQLFQALGNLHGTAPLYVSWDLNRFSLSPPVPLVPHPSQTHRLTWR